MQRLFSALYEELAAGRPAVLCSVIASSGSTPRGAGAKMVVRQDGGTAGTIGGGMVEHVSIGFAREALAAGMSYQKGFRLRPNDVADLGMICGGDVTVYFQYFEGGGKHLPLIAAIVELLSANSASWLVTALSEGAVWSMGVYDPVHGLRFTDAIGMEALTPLLLGRAVLVKGEPGYYIEPLAQGGMVYVFGGGHVSQELVPALARVGFRPVVFEDREAFADTRLFPGAAGCVQGDFTRVSDVLAITAEDYVVIMTRGHQKDFEVLCQALRTPACYVGVIGSRHKMAATRQRLMEAGIPECELSRIHNPIGLSIQAETPAEIAVSVTAELILHRAKLRA